MKYRCKSRLVLGMQCRKNCVVDVDFEPRACLLSPVWEEWEEVKEGGDK